MGVQVECLLENNFSKKALIQLPTKIDHEWKDLRGLIEKESTKFLQPIEKSDLAKAARWGFDDPSEETIENYLKYFEMETPTIP